MISVHVSVDIGLAGTGVAVWDAALWKRQLALPLLCDNVYSGVGNSDLTERCYRICRKILSARDGYRILSVVSEHPEFRRGELGEAVAQKDILGKMTFLTGYLAGMCGERGIEFVSVRPSEWIGQCSKEMVQRKIRHILPEIEQLKPISHSWDAIGIGLFVQGSFARK